VDKLIIPLRAVTHRQPREISETVDVSEINTDKELPQALRQVTMTGSLSAIDSDYVFQGTVSGTFGCLEPAKHVVTLSVGWLFEPAVAEKEDRETDYNGIEEVIDMEEEDNPLYHYDGDTVDLAAPALEELLLAAPSKMYCQEECRGLCPQCGVNWNVDTCECQVEEEPEIKNTGLSGLKEMFPDLSTGSSEE